MIIQIQPYLIKDESDTSTFILEPTMVFYNIMDETILENPLKKKPPTIFYEQTYLPSQILDLRQR